MKKQARKTRRQLKAEKLATAQKIVSQANATEDPIDSLEKLHNYVLSDKSTVTFTCSKVKNLSNECISWIFDLMERNMKSMYEKSSWGWDEKKKQAELTEDAAWYLIARHNGSNVGLSHFRFDIDDDVDVLYCYELQLEENVRRKGIGKFMMKSLEAIANRYGIQKVVLTALNSNLSAISFFNSLGYKPDITNPAASQKMDYLILSKRC